MPAPHVLVVDDDEALLRVYAGAIRRAGYEVTAAPDGREAFRNAITADYALILMDINMPDWDGVEAIRTLRVVKPGAKVVIVSAPLEQPALVRAEAEGLRVAAKVEKPVSVARLVELVREHAGAP